MLVDVTPDEIKRARAAVASQNGFTEEQLVAEVHRQGMTDAAYDQLLREQLFEGKLLQIDSAKEVRPTKPDELEAWAVKRRAALLQRLRAAAVIEVRL